jgi:cytochrome c oxidase subunit 2
VNRFWGPLWAALFLLVPVLGTLVFIAGAWGIPPFGGQWLPASLSEQGDAIDHLFYLILYLTGAVFIVTGVVLATSLFLFDGSRKEARSVKYSHGSAKMEIAWAVVPAIVLVFLSFYQMQTWADAKMLRPLVSKGADGVAGTADDLPQPAIARIVGRQWEWRFIYAGTDGVIGTPDDLHTVNEIVLPYGEPVVLEMESQDVLHSFFVSQLRLKQDVVPGMRQAVWFNARKAATLEIACAELCGDLHYFMRAKMILVSREDFDVWLEEQYALQRATQLKPSPGEPE